MFRAGDVDGGRQLAWDLDSSCIMINATAGILTQALGGPTVHAKFNGGESEYSIGPGVPILAPVPADRSLLKPGAAVFLAGPRVRTGP